MLPSSDGTWHHKHFLLKSNVVLQVPHLCQVGVAGYFSGLSYTEAALVIHTVGTVSAHIRIAC